MVFLVSLVEPVRARGEGGRVKQEPHREPRVGAQTAGPQETPGLAGLGASLPTAPDTEQPAATLRERCMGTLPLCSVPGKQK